MNKKKRFKVTFLLDNKNLWIQKYLLDFDFGLKRKYLFQIQKNKNLVKNQDIVFPLAYTKVLSKKFINDNKLVIIVHASRLPKDKGFAPIQNQILKNKKKLFISLIKAEDKVDSGNIYLVNSFSLKGHELYNEIRHFQAQECFKIIKEFLIKFPKIKSRKQYGQSNFNKKRYPKDSELNINKSIKSQFNLLRVCDNENFPAFFTYKKKKYVLKIYKDN